MLGTVPKEPRGTASGDSPWGRARPKSATWVVQGGVGCQGAAWPSFQQPAGGQGRRLLLHAIFLCNHGTAHHGGEAALIGAAGAVAGERGVGREMAGNTLMDGQGSPGCTVLCPTHARQHKSCTVLCLTHAQQHKSCTVLRPTHARQHKSHSSQPAPPQSHSPLHLSSTLLPDRSPCTTPTECR